MANNEIKTNAEIYREQRKERLAKAAKKNKSGKGDKIVGVIVKVLCIVLVAGFVLYGAGNILTKVFCLPQKTLTAAKYNDEKITVAEYNYYYMSLYNQIYQTTAQIDQYYGSGYGKMYTGFDASTDPAEQEYTSEDAPEGVKTWADYFRYTAPEKAFLQHEIYAAAKANKDFKLTDEQTKEMTEDIDERIKTLAEGAEKADYSLTNYISKNCGEGLTEKTYRELLERDYTAQYYLEWYKENVSDNLTDDEIKKYYNENKDDFDYAVLRAFTVSYKAAEKDSESTDPTYTKAQAKSRAEEFKGKITDEASFVKLAQEYAAPSQKTTFAEDSATLVSNITKSGLEQSCEALAKWAFDAKRVSGNTAVIDDSENEQYYIVYVVSPASPDKGTAGADVRHILVEAATTDSDGEALSDAEISKNFAAAKKEAEQILADWKKGAHTEETFAALATEKSDDTGSTENGGLYEDITSSSSYVPEFLNWALDSHKVGDTGIIKTDYGYHIMYFVGADKMEKWESDVRAAISDKDYGDYTDEMYDKVAEGIERNDSIIKYFVKTNEKLIAYSTSYTSSSSSTIS